MRKGLVVCIAAGLAVGAVMLPATPAGAELTRGGWGDPIEVPQAPPPVPEPALQGASQPRPVPAPVRRPVHRRVAPVAHPQPLPDGRVRF